MTSRARVAKREVAISILRSPALWLPVARILLRLGPLEVRFRLLCRWNGYTAQEVRRIARLQRLTGDCPL